MKYDIFNFFVRLFVIFECDETNPCLFGLLELEHPFRPGQVVHLLKSLHLSPEGAVSRVIGRVVRGRFISWACPQRETGLLGYWRWKGFGADRNITADCAAGTGVKTPGVSRT